MKQLSTIIEELENRSLYKYKCYNDDRFTLRILYFSADDYHTYVGFDLKNNTRICNVGTFYVDNKNTGLFYDNARMTFEVNKNTYKNYFISCRELISWNNHEILSLYPKSETFEKNNEI